MTKTSLSAPRPQDVHRLLAQAFNDGDLDALLSLYAHDATLVPEPGKTVSGRASLRDALGGFLALRPRNTVVRTLSVVTSGGVALTRSHWTLTGTNPADGGELTLSHRGVEIMAQQPDGSWRFLIDDPFAGDPGDSAVQGP